MKDVKEKAASRGKDSSSDVGVTVCVASEASQSDHRVKREAAPPVHNYKYGNKRIALHTASDDEEMVLAIK